MVRWFEDDDLSKKPEHPLNDSVIIMTPATAVRTTFHSFKRQPPRNEDGANLDENFRGRR